MATELRLASETMMPINRPHVFGCNPAWTAAMFRRTRSVTTMPQLANQNGYHMHMDWMAGRASMLFWNMVSWCPICHGVRYLLPFSIPNPSWLHSPFSLALFFVTVKGQVSRDMIWASEDFLCGCVSVGLVPKWAISSLLNFSTCRNFTNQIHWKVGRKWTPALKHAVQNPNFYILNPDLFGRVWRIRPESHFLLRVSGCQVG